MNDTRKLYTGTVPPRNAVIGRAVLIPFIPDVRSPILTHRHDYATGVWSETCHVPWPDEVLLSPEFGRDRPA